MESTTRERVPWFFFQKDEKCFFTYAQYLEPRTSIAVKIFDLQNAISLRILHTWGLRIPPTSLKLYFMDTHGQNHLLHDDDSLYQILGAYHPLWFCEHLPFGFERYRVSPFHLFARMFFVFRVVPNEPFLAKKSVPVLVLLCY